MAWALGTRRHVLPHTLLPLFPLFSHLPTNYEAFYWKRRSSSARPVSYCLAAPAQVVKGRRLHLWFPWDVEKICHFHQPLLALLNSRGHGGLGVPGAPSAASGTGPRRRAAALGGWRTVRLSLLCKKLAAAQKDHQSDLLVGDMGPREGSDWPCLSHPPWRKQTSNCGVSHRPQRPPAPLPSQPPHTCSLPGSSRGPPGPGLPPSPSF